MHDWHHQVNTQSKPIPSFKCTCLYGDLFEWCQEVIQPGSKPQLWQNECKNVINIIDNVSVLLFSSPELILSCLLLFKWAMWSMDLLFYHPSFFLIYGHVQIKESAAGHHILFQTGNFNETSWLNLQYYEHLFCVICWCKMLKDQQYFCSLRVHTIMSVFELNVWSIN